MQAGNEEEDCSCQRSGEVVPSPEKTTRSGLGSPEMITTSSGIIEGALMAAMDEELKVSGAMQNENEDE